MNDKKKVLLKKIGLERVEFRRKSLLEGGLIFNRKVGNISKKVGALRERSEEKIEEGGCDPQRNYVFSTSSI